MTVNVPLLRKTLEHITEHPEEWRQEMWATRGLSTPCGTAYCLAGHAVVMSGYEIKWQDDDSITGLVEDDDRSIAEVAAELLGLPAPYVNDVGLFHAGNDLRDLYRISSELTDGEIPIPDVLPDVLPDGS